MRKPTERTALVTHKGCLDGTGCAAVFIWSGGNRSNVIFKPPSSCMLTPEEAAPFDEVWFADLCPSSLEDPAGGKPFHVFDHHISNIKRFEGDPNCTFSIDHSGTSLLAQETDVFSRCGWGGQNIDEGRWVTDYERLVRALEAYDLGRFDHREGQFMADLAATLTQEQLLEMITDCGEHVSAVLNNVFSNATVEAARRARMIYAAKAAESALYTEFSPPGWDIASGMVNAGIAISPEPWKNAVAEEILKRAELAVIVDCTTWSLSFRSKTLDVSRMAQEYGGGGHMRAAGFKISSHNVLWAVLEEIFG